MEKSKIEKTFGQKATAVLLAGMLTVGVGVGLSGCGNEEQPVQPKVERPADPGTAPVEDTQTPEETPAEGHTVEGQPDSGIHTEAERQEVQDAADKKVESLIEAGCEVITVDIFPSSSPNGYEIEFVDGKTNKLMYYSSPDLI